MTLTLTVFVSCGGDDTPSDGGNTPSDGPCLHEWENIVSDDLIQTPATCSDPAVYYQKCKNCGEKGGKPFTSGTASDHIYTENPDSKHLVSAATCSNKAVYTESCTFCGKAGTETFEYGNTLPHTKVDAANVDTFALASTCDHANMYYYSCANCDYLYPDMFEFGPKRKHTDKHGDYICDYCDAPMKVWTDDPSVDNLTDKHEFGKN